MRRNVSMAATLALVVAAGCSKGLTEPSDEYAIVITVVDHRGDPLRPDWVHWYYPPEGDNYTGEHDAECLNGDCTRWGVRHALGLIQVDSEDGGVVYVSAGWQRPYPGDPLCMYSAYGARPVVPAFEQTVITELRLDTSVVSCHDG